MSQKQYQNQKPDLKLVQSKFEAWRKTKKHQREKIPEELWQAAEDLIGFYKISEITKTLRLKGNDFKKHMKNNDLNKVSAIVKSNMTEFFELKPYNCNHLTMFQECTIEMQDQDGSKMRIYVNGANSIDIINLTKIFWSKEK